jgi:hypothetical protein
MGLLPRLFFCSLPIEADEAVKKYRSVVGVVDLFDSVKLAEVHIIALTAGRKLILYLFNFVSLARV